jgi:hypothetical protein
MNNIFIILGLLLIITSCANNIELKQKYYLEKKNFHSNFTHTKSINDAETLCLSYLDSINKYNKTLITNLINTSADKATVYMKLYIIYNEKNSFLLAENALSNIIYRNKNSSPTNKLHLDYYTSSHKR